MGQQAILFDVDGTLVDSTYHHAFAWQRAFRRQGLTVPMWRLHRTIGMGGDRLVGHVAGDEVEERLGDTLRDGWEEEYAALVDEVPALPGATDLVRSLHGAGYAVALASSGAERFTRAAVDVLGVDELIAGMTNAGDVDDSKPAPDILGATLDQLGEVDAAVVVGDTPYDVEAAARIGLACLGVLTGGFSRAELEEAGAARVAADLTELADLDWAAYLRPPSDS